MIFSLFLSFFGGASAQAKKITVSCGAVGKELELCRTAAKKWAKDNGHQVEIVAAPNSSSARLGLYLQLLAAHSDDIDVFVIDTTWPGILGDFFLDLKDSINRKQIESYFPAFIKNNTVDGRLVALPWWADSGLLYYRKDLLEKYNRKVPTTWTELTETARWIMTAERKKGHEDMWGYVFQGRAYEGLTCNALEWIASTKGGTIVNPEGKITVHNPNAAKILSLAASWIGTISPQGVLNYAEEETRGVFQTGNAVFMRNWPYAIRMGNSSDSPIRDLFDIAPLPKGVATDGSMGEHTSTLGGWSLAVSKFSKHPKESISLVEYLTGRKEQLRRAQSGGFYPTIVDVYDDPSLRKIFPKLSKLKAVIGSAVFRPAQVTGHKYNKVSSEFWEAVHQTLSKQKEAEESLKNLEQRLLHISRKGKW